MAKTPTDIRSLARSHTERAIRVLARIMESPKAPASARVAASVALLDRGWGKPEQAMSLDVSGDATRYTISTEPPTAEEWERLYGAERIVQGNGKGH